MLGVSSQESERSCICVSGVSSQESERSCICVLGVSSQESERSCICVSGVLSQESNCHVFVCQGYQARKVIVMYLCVRGIKPGK